MQEKDNTSTSEEGINLKELFEIVWGAKSFVVLVSFLFFAFSVYYVKSLPDSYSAMEPIFHLLTLKLLYRLVDWAIWQEWLV